MLDDYITGLFVDLVSINLFIDRPVDRLTDKVFEFSHAADVGVFGIVSINNTNKILFGERLKVEQKLLHHAHVVVLLLWHSGEEAAQAVDHDHAKVEVEFFVFDG